ncbi:methionyl-trna synthetase [Phaffia rhodozyma]|uniref:methionine--tRNA ligase n=1 Tax=Phaffia rhodozyma TaxID=264483 RepID=A0A0F7SKF8_PHARH|nr:methionyl-trna synthetase [Phaffia rhodozyma]
MSTGPSSNIRKADGLFMNIAQPGSPPVLPKKGEKNTLITSALPYVNNVPHLGNIIGSTLSADVFARYSRTQNKPTIYICGTDEYGTATETKALDEGITPRELCDKFSALHAEIYKWFNISFDYFGRTSTEKQTEIVQDIYLNVRKNGLLLQKSADMTYCEGCSRFLADRYVEGTCPDCGYDDARGDQCDSCTRTFASPIELLKPRCKRDSKHTLVVRPSSHMYMRLDELQPRLEAWIKSAREKGEWDGNVVVNAKGEIIEARMKGGLRPSPITRDLTWGVAVPETGDAEEDAAMNGKVMYVWFDAPIGYLSLTAQYTDDWEQWWKNPKDVNLYQFMGKDNVYFHTVAFPATLLADGRDWTMLHRISSTEYLNYESGKFSKSRNVGVFGNNARDTNVPPDVWRYYLISNRPETGDSVFAWKEFVSKNNTELKNNLGNFVNRIIKFVAAKFDSVVPGPSSLAGGPLAPTDAPNAVDEVFISDINARLNTYIKSMDHTQFRSGLFELMAISARGNQYIQDNKLDNALLASDPERAAQVILMTINLIYALGPLVHPFMPVTADSICKQLNAPLRALPEAFSIDILPGHKLNQAEHLFKEIKEEKIDEWRKRYGGESSTPDAATPVLSKNQAAKKAKAEAAAALASLPRTPEVLALEAQIKTQGDKVTGLKKEKKEGGEAELASEVGELKKLKADLEALGRALKGMSL